MDFSFDVVACIVMAFSAIFYIAWLSFSVDYIKKICENNSSDIKSLSKSLNYCQGKHFIERYENE